MASTRMLFKQLHSLAFERHLFSFLHCSSSRADEIWPVVQHLLHRGLPSSLRDFLHSLLGLLDDVVPLFEQRRDINMELFAVETEIQFRMEDMDKMADALDQLAPEEEEERARLGKTIRANAHSELELR